MPTAWPVAGANSIRCAITTVASFTCCSSWRATVISWVPFCSSGRTVWKRSTCPRPAWLQREPAPAESLAAIRNQVKGDVFVEHNAGRRYTILFAADGKQEDFAEKEVPRGSVFVLGDHRDNSRDSRDPDFGFVPLGNVLG